MSPGSIIRKLNISFRTSPNVCVFQQSWGRIWYIYQHKLWQNRLDGFQYCKLSHSAYYRNTILLELQSRTSSSTSKGTNLGVCSHYDQQCGYHCDCWQRGVCGDVSVQPQMWQVAGSLALVMHMPFGWHQAHTGGPDRTAPRSHHPCNHGNWQCSIQHLTGKRRVTILNRSKLYLQLIISTSLLYI
jgi:hypothetical protein